MWYGIRPSLLWRAVVGRGSGGRARVRTTVSQRVPPLRCMHLRGILWVFFRVLLVGFGLFRLGAARAPSLVNPPYIRYPTYNKVIIFSLLGANPGL